MKITDKKMTFTYVMVGIFSAILIYIFFFSGAGSSLRAEKLDIFTADTLSAEWTRAEAGKKVVFSNTIPEITGTENYLSFRNFNSRVTVNLNGETVYTYGPDKAASAEKMSGVNLCLVPLKKGNGGQRVEVIFESGEPWSTLHTMSDVYIGEKNEIIMSIFAGNLGLLVFCFVMVTVGLGLLGMFLFSLFSSRKKADWVYFHMALFILLSATWIFTDSLLIQMLTSKTVLYGCLISYISLMLLPYPIINISKKFCPCGKRFFENFEVVFSVCTTCIVGLYALDAVNLILLLPFVHGFLLIAAAGTMFYAQKEYRSTSNVYAKYIFWAVALLVLGMLYELGQFYLGEKGDITGVFRGGLLILALFFLFIGLNRTKLSIEQKSKMGLYKRMAYMDIMTGMKNRNAYNKELETIRNTPAVYGNVQVVMMDVNNLKYHNDTFGHDSGDRLIKSAARIIREVFHNEKRCYRIGGDEFVVLLFDNTISEQEFRLELREQCSLFSKRENMDISISVGCAAAEWNAGEMPDIMALVDEADEEMYLHKMLMKKKDDYGKTVNMH